eukprot:XP_001693798.1 anaphase promoting complex subunit 1 [Chlamydomonas reinhardtii]
MQSCITQAGGRFKRSDGPGCALPPGAIQLYVREGAAPPGGDCCVEEVAVLGRRVAWTCGHRVRKLFTLGFEVLQATWALFPGYGRGEPVLCLLGSAGLLATCAAGGELQECAVPPGLEALWPAGEAGLLLGRCTAKATENVYSKGWPLPSHQLDLGAELEAPRRLEGAAKQFESKHGMEGLTRGVSRLRFGRDGRLRDVISALDSSHPLLLDGLGLHESDPEAPAKQQQQLLAAALRTMSLPLGRGAVALATGRPLPTEPTASVPSMCLAGLVPDQLSGHTVLDRLSWTDLYRYLSDEHDPTTIAVLVGMAAQRRGSMDAVVTRMLFLHLPARHPTSFPELELSPLVQAAALMGVGLLYEGSAHRVMAETLVVLEPDNSLNVSITSPAATVALALMYLRTHNAAVAARFALPATPYDLDATRPDVITLRALGGALVMWDAVQPSHLPTFHLLQSLSARRHPAQHHVLSSLGVGYGAHCAVSLALGFLFMGAGTHTFSTTNSSVAALLVALFPVLPHTPTDNRCHLQVFRHLYVLAARRRCLEAVDVDSQQLVYTVYRQLLLFVKKRAGSLSYSQDPSGIRSLLSRAFHNHQGLLRQGMPLDAGSLPLPSVCRRAIEPELQAELGRCLALHGLPPLADMAAALDTLRQLPAWQQQHPQTTNAAAAVGRCCRQGNIDLPACYCSVQAAEWTTAAAATLPHSGPSLPHSGPRSPRPLPRFQRPRPCSINRLLYPLFWKLMAQRSFCSSPQIIAKNQALAAKADELTAMAKDYAAMAKDNATKTEQLYTTKQQLLFALSAAGVFNARSFVEYVANQWRQEQAGGSAKKRQDVFKDGLRTRPDLVLCLLRDVPSWTPASMTDEQKVESMAANLEAIMQDASNDVHSFNTASGLILHRDVHNRPTVASLSCIARSMGVPCHIKEEKVAQRAGSCCLNHSTHIQ